MIIGLLTIEILIPNSASLKEKRRVLLSIKDRIKNKFNVSIAEIDAHDKWQRCVFGIVIISTDTKLIHSVFNNIITIFEENSEIEVINHNIQIL